MRPQLRRRAVQPHLLIDRIEGRNILELPVLFHAIILGLAAGCLGSVVYKYAIPQPVDKFTGKSADQRADEPLLPNFSQRARACQMR